MADVAARAATGTSTSIPPVLLFVGTGTSSSDVSAVKTILGDLKLAYATATSSQLNAMSETAIKAYKLFFVPGGNAITISKYLTHTAVTNVHNAIVNGGLHYLGISPALSLPETRVSIDYLNLTPNVWFNFYADEFKGIHKEAVEVKGSNGAKLDQYWENGPQLSGWAKSLANIRTERPRS